MRKSRFTELFAILQMQMIDHLPSLNRLFA